MCGIAGQLRLDGEPVDRALLERMANALIHRGPDGEGYYLEDGVGLAHRRLAIVDLAGGAQPMGDRGGSTPDTGDRAVVSYNGEIFNHLELRRELERGGERFQTNCDTEALVVGYAAWQQDVFAKLDAQFACAMWDRERRRLVLARDAVGIKPLYWSFENGVLTFASELKAFEAVFDNLSLDPTGLDLFLSYGYVPAPHSIFAEVRKLMPGQVLTLDAKEGATPQLDYFMRPEALYVPDEGVEGFADADDLHEELTRAVGAQLMSDVPLGAFLSGGTDSTAVVQAMVEHEQSPLCCTIAYDTDSTDLDRSREASDHLGARLQSEVLEREALLAALPDLAGSFDEPLASDSLLPTDAVCALARRSVTVALAGDGGDEILGGYRRFFHHLNGSQEPAFKRGLQRGVGALLGALHVEGGTVRRLQAKGLPPGPRYARYHLRTSMRRRTELYNPDFLGILGRPDDGDYLAALYDESHAEGEAERIASVDFQSFLPEHALVKVDRLSMRHSLEVRVPMLSPRMIRRAYATRFDLKYERDSRGSIVAGKRILKDVLRRRLPDSLVDARKKGFSAPLKDWLGPREMQGMRDVLLSPEAGQIFDHKKLDRFLEKNASGGRGTNFLYTLFVLGLWIERHPIRSLARATA